MQDGQIMMALSAPLLSHNIGQKTDMSNINLAFENHMYTTRHTEDGRHKLTATSPVVMHFPTINAGISDRLYKQNATDLLQTR